MSPTPNDAAQKSLVRARREHAKAWGRVDRSIEETEYVLDHWQEYGIEDFSTRVRLTEITLYNIQEES